MQLIDVEHNYFDKVKIIVQSKEIYSVLELLWDDDNFIKIFPKIKNIKEKIIENC